jgi:hypothetical protein
MALIFFLVFIFSFLIGLAIISIVIHQGHVYSILVKTPGFGVPGSPVQTMLENLCATTGKTFAHSSTVSFTACCSRFLRVSLIGINALFERRGFKYIFIHSGYWLVTIALMGGVISQFA